MNLFLFAIFIFSTSNAIVIDLTHSTLNSTLDFNQLVLIDFYAPWCYFSNLLDPIFLEASNKLEEEFKNNGTVVLGKVNCENEDKLCRKYDIKKYPTIKIFHYGEMSNREYRGARNPLAFVNYVKQSLSDPIVYFKEDENINKEIDKSYIIGYFHENLGSNFEIFRKVAYQLRDNCIFFIKETNDHSLGKITFESENTVRELDGSVNFNEFKSSITKLCIPPVRHITFQNAEDIMEENLPLIILFYHPQNYEITVRYTKFVKTYMLSYTDSVNFVYADGQKFSHPIKHLGKSEQDLPFFVIDSFQHMFLLSHSADNILNNAEIMKEYILDLQSGKLHKEFHNGPDAGLNIQKSQAEVKANNGESINQHTTLISVFKKLKPNSNRYTLLHDEF